MHSSHYPKRDELEDDFQLVPSMASPPLSPYYTNNSPMSEFYGSQMSLVESPPSMPPGSQVPYVIALVGPNQFAAVPYTPSIAAASIPTHPNFNPNMYYSQFSPPPALPAPHRASVSGRRASNSTSNSAARRTSLATNSERRSGAPISHPFALWVGNIPSDATHDELWNFFNTVRDGSKEPAGLDSVHLISRSNCAFINFSSQTHLQRAIVTCNGIPLRPHDKRCKSLVCRIPEDTSISSPRRVAQQKMHKDQEPLRTNSFGNPS